MERHAPPKRDTDLGTDKHHAACSAGTAERSCRPSRDSSLSIQCPLDPPQRAGTSYTPSTSATVNPNVNSAYVRGPASYAEVANMTPSDFYGRMATVMDGNPPT